MRTRAEKQKWYRLEMSILGYLPPLICFSYSLKAVFYFFGLDTTLFNVIGDTSLIPLFFLFLSSYVFEFCVQHRLFLYYALLNTCTTIYNHYIGIGSGVKSYIIVGLGLLGVFLYIFLTAHLDKVEKEKQLKEKQNGNNQNSKGRGVSG